MAQRTRGGGAAGRATVSTTTVGATGPFSFSSQPRALDPTRPKYRGNAAAAATTTTTAAGDGGIMEDYRVRRESIIPLLRGTEKLTLPSLAAIAAARKSKQQQQLGTAAAAAATADDGPGPVAGRQHLTVQTEAFLEELAERPRAAEAETQTEAFRDRPPSPLFVPKKSGVDAAAQVDSRELFDFDAEVAPLLEALVGRTLDQALAELVEEEELASLRARQDDFARRRAAEAAEVQRLEEAARRRADETRRRLAQEQKRAADEQSARLEAERREQARAGVADVAKTLYARLRAEGFFRDRVERDVSGAFVPWLRAAVAGELAGAQVSREVLRRLVAHALERSASRFVPPSL